jgi:hypothetical protein
MSGLRSNFPNLKSNQKINSLPILLLVSILPIYMILSLSTGTTDVDYFAAWSREVVHGHMFQIYQLDQTEPYLYKVGTNFTSTYPYPPFGVYLLALFGLLTSSFAGDNLNSFVYGANLLSVMSIFIISYAIYRMSLENTLNKKLRRVLIFLMNPLTMLLYCLLGYQDAVVCACLAVGLLMVRDGRFLATGICFGLAAWTKQLSWILAIPVLLYFLKLGRGASSRFYCGFALSSLIVLLPFILSGNLFVLLRMLFKGSVHYVYSANAYNLPWFVGMLRNGESFASSYQLSSQGLESGNFQFLWFSTAYSFFSSLFLLFMVVTLIWFKKLRMTPDESLLYFFVLFPVTYFIVAPGVHENHMMFVLPIFLLWKNSHGLRYFLYFGFLTSINCFIHYGIGRNWSQVVELPTFSQLDLNLIGTFLFLGTVAGWAVLCQDLFREAQAMVQRRKGYKKSHRQVRRNQLSKK